MEQVFDLIVAQFPTLAGMVFFLTLLYLVFREYRKSRKELNETVEQAVNARLGAILTSIQEQAIETETLSKKVVGRYTELEGQYRLFEDGLKARELEITGLYEEATRRLKTLRKAIPDVDELSAYDIYYEARNAESSQAKAALCQKILTHADATSKELEVAGDLMRRENRNVLARKLYQKAHDIDPDNQSVFVELLALQIEQDYKARPTARDGAIELMTHAPTTIGFGRVCDAFLHIDQYGDVYELCQRVLDAQGPGLSRKLRVMVLRNKAVALRELGRFEESLATYEEALSISPDDTNTLKPYLSILDDQRNYDEYLRIARQLIDTDPINVFYYRSMIGKLIELRRWEEAREWLFRTEALEKDVHELEFLRVAAQRISAALSEPAEPKLTSLAAPPHNGPSEKSGEGEADA